MKKRAFIWLLVCCTLLSTFARGEIYNDFDGWQQRFLAAWEEAYPEAAELRVTPSNPAETDGEPIVVQLWLGDAVLLSAQPKEGSDFPQVTVYLSNDAANQAASMEAAHALFAEAIFDAVLATLGEAPSGDAAANKMALAEKAGELLEDAMFPMRTYDVGEHTVMLTRDLDAPNLIATIMWTMP